MYETGLIGVEAKTATDPARVLKVVKQEMHEMSAENAEMIALGTLRDGTDPRLWAGSSSLAKRLESGEITMGRVHEAVNYANECYVDVTPGAAERCVEDRTEEGYDDNNPADYGAPLGPQKPGGTPDVALARRLMHEPEKAGSIAEDVEATASQVQDGKFKPGGHTDEHANGQKTGCGSIDNERAKIELIQNPETAPAIESKVSAMLGLADRQLSKDSFARLRSGAKTLLGRAGKYFEDLSKVPETIKRFNPKGEPKVVGPHNQVAVIINLVEGETFHTNHYNQRDNAKLTIHNLDLWDIINNYDEDEQVALLAQTVATLMRITDGSALLYVRRSKQTLEQAA